VHNTFSALRLSFSIMLPAQEFEQLLAAAKQRGGRLKKLAKRAEKLLAQQYKLRQKIETLAARINMLLTISHSQVSTLNWDEVAAPFGKTKLLGLVAFVVDENVPIAFLAWQGKVYNTWPEVAGLVACYCYKIALCFEKAFRAAQELQEIIAELKKELEGEKQV